MSSFVKIPCWYAMQLFFMFFEKRVAYFSCFATLLGEFRHKNNSFCLVCTDPQMLDQKSNDWRSIFLWLNIVLNLKRK